MRIISSLVVATALAASGVGLTAQSKEFLPLTPMDRIQIQQLIARYAYALDTGGRNGYDYADLFAADGVFVGMNQGADRPALSRARHAWRRWRAAARAIRTTSATTSPT